MAQLVRSGNTYGAAFECVKRETVFPASVARLRDCAFARFADLGLPTTKLERWRFTNIAPIAQTEPSLADWPPPYSTWTGDASASGTVHSRNTSSAKMISSRAKPNSKRYSTRN